MPLPPKRSFEKYFRQKRRKMVPEAMHWIMRGPDLKSLVKPRRPNTGNRLPRMGFGISLLAFCYNEFDLSCPAAEERSKLAGAAPVQNTS